MPALFCLQQYDQIIPRSKENFSNLRKITCEAHLTEFKVILAYEAEFLSVFQHHLSFFLCRNIIRFCLKQRKLQQLTDDFKSKFSVTSASDEVSFCSQTMNKSVS
jgi:hypothetical protein